MWTREPTDPAPGMSTALGWLFGGLGVLAVASFLAATRLHWGAALEPAAFAYPSGLPNQCPHHEHPGTSRPAGGKTAHPHKDEQGDAGAQLPRFHVRTPRNYDSRFAHPLLVVFSPAGFSGKLTERFTGLTAMATARGLIVAYVDHVPLGLKQARRLAHLPATIAAEWCIDRDRVSLAGHSDGGTVAQVIGLLEERAAAAPVAIVASAGGLLESDFPALTCPVRMHVLLFHGATDDHFPGYGESAAQGWARCLRCDAEPQTDAQGCLAYSGCAGSLRLCLHDGGHLTWPEAARARMVAMAAKPPPD